MTNKFWKDGEIEDEITDASEYELRITDIKRRVQRFLRPEEFKTTTRIRRQLPTTPPTIRRERPITPPTPRRQLPATPTGQNVGLALGQSPLSNFSGSGSGSGNSKLPKLNLPRFNGNIVNFLSFWESFNIAVHQNQDIPPILKFSYLKSYLDGEAALTVEGLPLTEANYEDAIEILHTRFGKKQKIITKHMNELRKMTPCRSGEVSQIRFTYDKINVHVRGLQALGIDPDHYGSLLIPVILEIIPEEIALHVSRQSSRDIWSITELLDIIRMEIEAREMRDQTKMEKKQSGRIGTGQKVNINQGTTSIFVAKSEVRPKQGIECYFCKGGHFTSDCTKVVNLSERKGILKRDGRCFRCLRIGHLAKECPNEKSCRKCRGKHHASICEKKTGDNEGETSANETKTNVGRQSITATSRGPTTVGKVLLQTAKAVAVNPNNGKKCEIRILFDSGSQRSYISEEVKDKLQLKAEKKETLNLNTFGNSKFKKQDCQLVSFCVELSNGQLIRLTALTYPEICSPLPTQVDIGSFTHLHGLDFADDIEVGTKDNISVLIGADQYYEIVVGDIVRGEQGPVAVRSKLGWILSGNTGNLESENIYVSSNLCVVGSEEPIIGEDNCELVEALKSFWHVENTGLENDVGGSGTDKFCSINFTGDRYEVGLPWKPVEPNNVASNLEQCTNRLNSLHSRLSKEPDLLREYDNIFREQLDQGIIEKVAPSEVDNDNVRFMPHFGVIRRDRITSKLRIVFDASSKVSADELSLNDRSESGPNFIPMLFDVLVKFRAHVIGITADIEKAFLQIEIRPEDRDFLRFLWFDDIGSAEPTVVQLRYARLPFGLRPSPAVLGSVLREHVSSYQGENPETVKVLKGLFVDDLSTGADSVENAYKMYLESKQILQEGKFNLRKWNSNSKELLERIQETERAIGKNETGDSNPGVSEDDQSYVQASIGLNTGKETVKILGLNWNTESDEFCYDFSEIIELAKSLPVSKRTLLKLTAKIFDPLGILSVFTVNMKAMFQSLCIDKVSWDEELQGNARLEFNSFLCRLQQMGKVRIPRCYFSLHNEVRTYQIHGFSDASEKAYACVVYLRTEYKNGFVESRIIASKAKVARLRSKPF